MSVPDAIAYPKKLIMAKKKGAITTQRGKRGRRGNANAESKSKAWALQMNVLFAS